MEILHDNYFYKRMFNQMMNGLGELEMNGQIEEWMDG